MSFPLERALVVKANEVVDIDDAVPCVEVTEVIEDVPPQESSFSTDNALQTSATTDKRKRPAPEVTEKRTPKQNKGGPFGASWEQDCLMERFQKFVAEQRSVYDGSDSDVLASLGERFINTYVRVECKINDLQLDAYDDQWRSTTPPGWTRAFHGTQHGKPWNIYRTPSSSSPCHSRRAAWVRQLQNECTPKAIAALMTTHASRAYPPLRFHTAVAQKCDDQIREIMMIKVRATEMCRSPKTCVVLEKKHGTIQVMGSNVHEENTDARLLHAKNHIARFYKQGSSKCDWTIRLSNVTGLLWNANAVEMRRVASDNAPEHIGPHELLIWAQDKDISTNVCINFVTGTDDDKSRSLKHLVNHIFYLFPQTTVQRLDRNEGEWCRTSDPANRVATGLTEPSAAALTPSSEPVPQTEGMDIDALAHALGVDPALATGAETEPEPESELEPAPKPAPTWSAEISRTQYNPGTVVCIISETETHKGHKGAIVVKDDGTGDWLTVRVIGEESNTDVNFWNVRIPHAPGLAVMFRTMNAIIVEDDGGFLIKIRVEGADNSWDEGVEVPHYDVKLRKVCSDNPIPPRPAMPDFPKLCMPQGKYVLPAYHPMTDNELAEFRRRFAVADLVPQMCGDPPRRCEPDKFETTVIVPVLDAALRVGLACERPSEIWKNEVVSELKAQCYDKQELKERHPGLRSMKECNRFTWAEVAEWSDVLGVDICAGLDGPTNPVIDRMAQHNLCQKRNEKNSALLEAKRAIGEWDVKYAKFRLPGLKKVKHV